MKPSARQSDKGILKAEAGLQKFSLMRYEPAEDLAPFIEHYWTVRWDLRGQAPHRQTILSYPNVNISFERENGGTFAGVYGIPEETYTRHLEGEGAVLGIKFRAGGFYPFWKQPVSGLSGQILSLPAVFGEGGAQWERQMFAMGGEEQMVRLTEQFLRERAPEMDGNLELIGQIVRDVADHRDMTKVEDIVTRFGVNKRTLQRLFSRYVGVSPKWIIQRCRLQEAAELMEKGSSLNWPKLAQDLGFYDQAHFIKTFKAMIGKSPEEYVREAGIL